MIIFSPNVNYRLCPLINVFINLLLHYFLAPDFFFKSGPSHLFMYLALSIGNVWVALKKETSHLTTWVVCFFFISDFVTYYLIFTTSEFLNCSTFLLYHSS